MVSSKFFNRIKKPVAFALFILLQLSIITFILANEYCTLLEKGDALYRQFDNAAALEFYRQACQAAENNYEALLKTTRAYNDLGEDCWETDKTQAEENFRLAVEHAEQLQQQFPDSAKSYVYLATTYGNLALFKGGKDKVKLARNLETNCQKAIALNPARGMPYLILGIYYREVANLNWFLKTFAKAFYGGMPGGSNKDSESMLLKAIELMPENLDAHYQLAWAYKKMKQREKAIAYLKNVIELPISDHRDFRRKELAENLLADWDILAEKQGG